MYSYERHYGPELELKTKGELMAWIYTQPSSGATAKMNGVTWHWCDHCGKLGSHTSDSSYNANSGGRKRARHNAFNANISPQEDSSKHTRDDQKSQYSSSDSEDSCSDSDME